MTTIISSPLEFGFEITGGYQIEGVAPVDSNTSFTGENVTFDCQGFDRFGEANPGVIEFDFEILGELLNKAVIADPLEFNFELIGNSSPGLYLADGEVLEFAFELLSLGSFTSSSKQNWIRWSKIGSADFRVDRSNLAGELAFQHSGTLWEIRKIRNSIIVFGDNGIFRLLPRDQFFGYQRISKVGIASRDAVASDGGEEESNVGWFIDRDGYLVELTDGMRRLGYNEQLSLLTNPVLSFDFRDRLLYICDGTTGFIFNPEQESFVQGPPAVTDIGYVNGLQYGISPTTITSLPFTATTDIMDMGTRKLKTIFHVEIATNKTEAIELSISFRENARAAFIQSPWVRFTPRGIAYLPCYGIDFKLNFRSTVAEPLKVIDMIKVNGAVHAYSALDTFAER